MRLIGNKTKLLGSIEECLADRGVTGGTFVDIFAGTSSVGAHFKRAGFKVVANDLLAMCYAKAVARIEVSRYPRFTKWRAAVKSELASRSFRESYASAPAVQSRFAFTDEASAGEQTVKFDRRARPLAEAIHFLNTRIEPVEGLIFRSFCPSGGAERMYFTDENGQRIDGILQHLRAHHRAGTLSRGEFYLLLSALLSSIDRVANITGTYGAYLKRWQSSARRHLELKIPEVGESPLRHRAFSEDATQLVRRVDGDVLYIDPPYNARQYAANYHVLQIVAEYHSIEDLPAYEAALYGKTGLRPYKELRSQFCVPPSRQAPHRNALSAMTELVLSTRCRHVLISYNEEGLLSREELGGILARFSGQRSYDYDTQMREVLYRRFRSDVDRDGLGDGGKRSYRVIEGKGRDQISEWLLWASRDGADASARAGRTPRPSSPRAQS